MFVISVTSFFKLIDRSYLKTFTTTMTGPQYCVTLFEGADTDDQRVSIFKKHPSYYSSIENELQAFVGDHWLIWQADRPDWFTDDIIATIPDRFIPADEVERMNRESGRGQRRRNSFMGSIGEGRRSSGRSEGGGVISGGARVAPIN